MKIGCMFTFFVVPPLTPLICIVNESHAVQSIQSYLVSFVRIIEHFSALDLVFIASRTRTTWTRWHCCLQSFLVLLAFGVRVGFTVERQIILPNRQEHDLPSTRGRKKSIVENRAWESFSLLGLPMRLPMIRVLPFSTFRSMHAHNIHRLFRYNVSLVHFVTKRIHSIFYT